MELLQREIHLLGLLLESRFREIHTFLVHLHEQLLDAGLGEDRSSLFLLLSGGSSGRRKDSAVASAKGLVSMTWL